MPFTAAPTAVVGALELIKTRINEAELGFNPNFNEVLTAAYMEEQKMAVCLVATRLVIPLNLLFTVP